jgi:hypothetical protein
VEELEHAGQEIERSYYNFSEGMSSLVHVFQGVSKDAPVKRAVLVGCNTTFCRSHENSKTIPQMIFLILD